jgi:antitoxin MazE
MVVVKIIQIGNSKGIRIPKQVLEEFDLDENSEIEMDTQNGSIILKPKNYPRNNWISQFQEAQAVYEKPAADKNEFIELANEFDEQEWTW